MTTPIDLTGQKFSRLTATSHQGGGLWRCKCACGLESIVRGRDLRRGSIRSCGCLRREKAQNLSRINIVHGAARRKYRHGEYNVWIDMKARCSNPKQRDFKHYGGRGITVCQQWNSFTQFLQDMGRPQPGQTLDRINNDGNYSPENCRWASRQQQANNRRTTRLLTFNGKTMSLSAWSMEMGLARCRVGARLKEGWSLERALKPSERALKPSKVSGEPNSARDRGRERRCGQINN